MPTTGGTDITTDKVLDIEASALALHVRQPPLSFVLYSDATYAYYCQAKPGTAKSTAAWQVVRHTLADCTFTFAGKGAFEHVATNIAAVAGLTYTLGA